MAAESHYNDWGYRILLLRARRQDSPAITPGYLDPAGFIEFMKMNLARGVSLLKAANFQPVVLTVGETLHVRPGMIHAHRNASSTEKLVFLEFVIVDKAQRSTVPMR